MLDLVYRTYSGEHMDDPVKELSTELVEEFSKSLDKDFFIEKFN